MMMIASSSLVLITKVGKTPLLSLVYRAMGMMMQTIYPYRKSQRRLGEVKLHKTIKIQTIVTIDHPEEFGIAIKFEIL